MRDHRVVVHGLACGAVHHFQVRSTDESANRGESLDQVHSAGPCPLGVRSDEFDGLALDEGVWTFVDPTGDAGLSVGNGKASIALPAGVRHDLWTNADEVPRLLQAVPNIDFEVEATFDSAVTSQYQLQGIVVEQDADDLLRLELHHDGTATRLFLGSVVAGEGVALHSSTVFGGAPIRLKVRRSGATWTVSHSPDGINWTSAATFARAMNVSALGVYAGNTGVSPPAFTAAVDAFREVSPPPDVTPPVITAVAAAPRTYSAVVTWTTDEDATSSVEYGSTISYELGTVVDATRVRQHSLTVRGLACEAAYHFRVGSEDEAGNRSSSSDAVVTTTTCDDSSGPDIDVWYGATQSFGNIGVPQRWVNVVGNADDPNGVSALRYSLNGGPEQLLTIGPDGVRLVDPGDFNIELDHEALVAGANTLRIVAVDGGGNLSTRDVTVNWLGPSTWTLPTTVSWNAASSINDVAQITDGRWALVAGGVRPLATGYDRVIVLGQHTWGSYEVQVPITLHRFDSSKPHAGVGVAMGWQGHTGSAQPRFGHPYGGLCSYGRPQPEPALPRLEITTNPSENSDRTVVDTAISLIPDVTYTMRFRRESRGDGTSRYSCKVWRADQPEPASWHLTTDLADWWAETGPHPGSTLLLAHQVDATFGDVQVVPVGG